MKEYQIRENLKAKYEELNSMKKVADYYGVSKKLILNYMKKFEIDRNDARLNLNVEKMIEMLESGFTITKIAKEFGVSMPTIKNRLDEIGVETDLYHKGYILKDSGYILVQANNHPMKDSKGYVPLHRLVVEENIGRFLTKDEVVHHKDKNKLNNDISNLEILNSSDHAKIHSIEERKIVDILEIRNMLDDGYKLDEVSKKYGISINTIREKLKKYGLYKPLPRGSSSHKIKRS